MNLHGPSLGVTGFGFGESHGLSPPGSICGPSPVMRASSSVENGEAWSPPFFFHRGPQFIAFHWTDIQCLQCAGQQGSGVTGLGAADRR